MALKVTTHEADGVTVVEPDGHLVFGEDLSALRERVKGLIAEGKRKIVLNMGHVAKIDSMGLGVLVTAYYSASTRGASLRLCNLGRQLKEVLQITKLINVFEVSNTEADAVRSLSSISVTE